VANALEYAQSLVAVPSVSRDSNGPVSDVVERHLRALGFEVERQEFLDPQGVPKSNVVSRRARRFCSDRSRWSTEWSRQMRHEGIDCLHAGGRQSSE
jgi:hypothetical protein